MTKAQLAIYLGIIFFLLLGMSSLVEIYKKLIRKNKSKTWENRIIGFVLSVFATIGLAELHILQPLVSYLGAPRWTDYVAYSVLFYYLQFQVDMKIIKNLIKFCLQLI